MGAGPPPELREGRCTRAHYTSFCAVCVSTRVSVLPKHAWACALPHQSPRVGTQRRSGGPSELRGGTAVFPHG